MTEIQHENSENISQPVVALIISIITCFVLFLPTLFLWVGLAMAVGTCYTPPEARNLFAANLAGDLSRSLPIIGCIIAVAISCFVTYILKIRKIFWANVLTIVMTGGALWIVINIILRLKDIGC